LAPQTHEALEMAVTQELEALLIDHPDLTIEKTDELEEALLEGLTPIAAKQAPLSEQSSTPDKERTTGEAHAVESYADSPEGQKERLENLKAFNDLVAAHPELASLRTVLLHDLDAYLQEPYQQV
jgi:hypothetical protein